MKNPTPSQLLYWQKLKGRPPIGVDNHGREPWNKGTKGLIKVNSGSFKKGEHRSMETEFKKSSVPWSKLHANEMPSNENHHMWKPDNQVGYVSLHKWVARKLGKPQICWNCKDITAKRYEWANINKQYRRNLTDWVRLCKSCHERYDKKGMVLSCV